MALTNTTIIWLHGLGASGDDFKPIAEELNLPGVRTVFPDAPIRPITINNGMRMRAWYDIAYNDLQLVEDETGIRASSQAIIDLIEQEQGQVFLAGFSQGGAIALYTALTYSKPLAGVIALSTYLPLKTKLMPANTSLPIFMAHGTEDTVIPLKAASASKECLKEWGYSVEWRTYPMPHSVCPQEIQDIRQWFLNRGVL